MTGAAAGSRERDMLVWYEGRSMVTLYWKHGLKARERGKESAREQQGAGAQIPEAGSADGVSRRPSVAGSCSGILEPIWW